MENVDTENVENFAGMFENDEALESLDVSKFDTSNATDLSNIFWRLRKVPSLDLSKFNTSKVINMGGMFYDDEVIKTLDVSSFDTSKVEDMHQMFELCKGMKTLNIPNFDMSNIGSDPDSNVDYPDASFMLSDTPLDELTLGEKNLNQMKAAGNLDQFKNWISVGSGDFNNPQGMPSIDENSIFDDKNGYTYMEVPGAVYHGTNTVTVKSNLGDISIDIPSSKSPKYVGSFLNIDVPEKKGYKASPNKIKVMADKDNSLVAEPSSITYTKDKDNSGSSSGSSSSSSTSSNSGSSSSIEDNMKIESSVQYVTVNPDVKEASLYDSDGKLINSRALAKNSSWYSDKIMTRNNNKYYRVAQNEWVKATDVYDYQKTNDIVETKNKDITYLSTIFGKRITNRALGKDTDWKTDKIVKIDGTTYYRVATNEFVNANDVNLV